MEEFCLFIEYGVQCQAYELPYPQLPERYQRCPGFRGHVTDQEHMSDMKSLIFSLLDFVTSISKKRGHDNVDEAGNMPFLKKMGNDIIEANNNGNVALRTTLVLMQRCIFAIIDRISENHNIQSVLMDDRGIAEARDATAEYKD